MGVGILVNYFDRVNLTVSGGVLCNKMLRDELEFACYEAGIDLILAEPAFCTDNAGMIAGVAAEKLAALAKPRRNAISLSGRSVLNR